MLAAGALPAAARTQHQTVPISGFEISGFPVAIALAGAPRAAISDNRIAGGGSISVLTSGSPRTRISNNQLTGAPDVITAIGICVEGSDASKLVDNDVSGHVTAMCLSSSGLDVVDNRTHDNHIGIYVNPGYRDITIRNNTVTNNNRVEAVPIPVPTGMGIIVEAG